MSRAIARTTVPRPGTQEIATLISQEAKRQGVPPWVALTFAEIKSGLNPLICGDRDRAARHPKQWEALRERTPDNPGIAEPDLWGAYGLFQLLAAYHLLPNEHPTVLFDANINARRGIAAIASALRKTGGDVVQARRLSVCGPEILCFTQKFGSQTDCSQFIR